MTYETIQTKKKLIEFENCTLNRVDVGDSWLLISIWEQIESSIQWEGNPRKERVKIAWNFHENFSETSKFYGSFQLLHIIIALVFAQHGKDVSGLRRPKHKWGKKGETNFQVESRQRGKKGMKTFPYKLVLRLDFTVDISLISSTCLRSKLSFFLLCHIRPSSRLDSSARWADGDVEDGWLWVEQRSWHFWVLMRLCFITIFR